MAPSAFLKDQFFDHADNQQNGVSSTPPRYRFVVRWPEHGYLDAEGTGFPNDAAARRYAERMIRELKESGGDYDHPELQMVVTDDDGNEIFVIPFNPN
jgi:hypothetical protein